MSRELVVKDCYLYMEIDDDETKNEALLRLINTLPENIDYMFDNDKVEVRDI